MKRSHALSLIAAMLGTHCFSGEIAIPQTTAEVFAESNLLGNIITDNNQDPNSYNYGYNNASVYDNYFQDGISAYTSASSNINHYYEGQLPGLIGPLDTGYEGYSLTSSYVSSSISSYYAQLPPSNELFGSAKTGINEQITFNSNSLAGGSGTLRMNISGYASMSHHLYHEGMTNESLHTSILGQLTLGSEVVEIVKVIKTTDFTTDHETQTETSSNLTETTYTYNDITYHNYDFDTIFEVPLVFGQEIAFQLYSEVLTAAGFASFVQGNTDLGLQLNWFQVLDASGNPVSDLIIQGSDIFTTPIPEPSTYLMLGTGLGLALLYFRRRKKVAERAIS